MRGDALAELAEADDAERLAVEVAADGRLPVRAGFQPRVFEADVAGEFQHQADGDAAVGLPSESVPQTVTPRAAGGLTSMEALRAPVVMSSLRSGRASITLALNGGALAHHADDGETLQRLDDLVLRAERRW